LPDAAILLPLKVNATAREVPATRVARAPATVIMLPDPSVNSPLTL